jgi:hypothetical protein
MKRWASSPSIPIDHRISPRLDQTLQTIMQTAQHPVGVFPAYTQHQSEIALKIREKKLSLTGDDFDITVRAPPCLVVHPLLTEISSLGRGHRRRRVPCRWQSI